MDKAKSFIEKYATRANILILFFLVILINILVFPTVIPMEQRPIDLALFFTPSEAYALIASYSSDLRDTYKMAVLSVDMVYPLIYSLLFSFLLVQFYKESYLILFPILIFIADFIENLGIATLLTNYPNELYTWAWITSVFSALKWFLILIALLLIFWGFIKKILLKK